MTRYEYKLVPAPTRGVKAKGVRTAEARFAHAIETAINALAAEGWEYLRADTLPHEERHGLTGTATTFRSLLVFRRALAAMQAAEDRAAAPAEPAFPLPSVLAAPEASETVQAGPAEGPEPATGGRSAGSAETAGETGADLEIRPQDVAASLRKSEDGR